jgi:hypothetical protein
VTANSIEQSISSLLYEFFGVNFQRFGVWFSNKNFNLLKVADVENVTLVDIDF